MNLVDIGIGFAIGFLVGIGAALFYLRWKLRRQLGSIENQMQDMMDLTSNMGDMTEDLDVDFEEEAKEKEEKE